MYMIKFCCYDCGIQVRVVFREKNLTFSIEGKLHSEKECLTDNGYFKCIFCHKITKNIKFEYIYS